MMVSLLVAVAALAPLVSPTLAAAIAEPAANANANAAAPYIQNGAFTKSPLRPQWYWNQLGAGVSREPLPGSPGNFAMRIKNINCEYEQYASIFGHMINTVPGRRYRMTFNFLFTRDTDDVQWGASGFGAMPYCDPCRGFEYTNVRYPGTVTGGQLYQWRGDFKGDENATGRPVVFNVAVETCSYRGQTYIDDFVISEL